MRAFAFQRTGSVAEALAAHGTSPSASFVAGGTTLIDLVKLEVMRPERIVDVNHLPLARVEALSDGGLRIGALVRNSDLAWHADVKARYPVLSTALLSGATAQLRNMATTAGNLMQRTRCQYFRDNVSPCNKREPGSGCAALEGYNRIHAVLGGSETCIATHPSDMCVALAVLDARVLTTGTDGQRSIAFDEFHRLPGDSPQIDTNLRADEIITAIELPPKGFAKNYTYLKIRDRLSYAFALVSVAVGLDIEGDSIKDARLALGGVAHKPWRDPEAEAQLSGASPTRDSFVRAAETLLRRARGFGHNDFKIELARRAIVRALGQAARGTPQSQADKRVK
jgi:xanthine dehydrogenase YagS FAD-binding subunit